MNSKISGITQYFPNFSSNDFHFWKYRSITKCKAGFSGITVAFLSVGNMVCDYSLSQLSVAVQSDFFEGQTGYKKCKGYL